IRSVHEQVKVIDVSQRRTIRVAPAFSVEMQTKHKIRMQFEIHQRCAASNLSIAVEQNFALPTDGLLFRRISWIKNVNTRLRHAILDKNLSGELAKIIRTLGRNRFNAISHKRNFCTQFAQSRRRHSCYAQGQIALLNRLAVADLKPTLLHLRPVPTKMPRIERDLQTG